MNQVQLMEEKRGKSQFLDKVNYPDDIRKMDIQGLSGLARDIRNLIIDVVSKHGGHLASSLGAVELTLAIHYVFHAPNDRIVWDVGHQAYAHKIITGRKERFHTLRQKGGISGFPKREESPYDVFNVGHSGTSISAATGMMEASCLRNEDRKIVVVIGDGSMTSGMAYEALNWAGDRKKNIIIILNDNEMSISPNVGALSSYLNCVMTGHRAMALRNDIKNLFKQIPGIGQQMIRFTRQLEESVKALVVPGALFEDFGYTYVGPLEGHRLDHLIRNLENVKSLNGPVLVHVITKKGKGYRFAEEKPLLFHGIGPFNIETGKPAGGEDYPITYSRMFGNTAVKLAAENRSVIAITAAMCEGTGLDGFAKAYPDRFFDVGIAEQHGVTLAAGFAVEGLKPIVAIYSSFLQRAYDQILHDVCLQKLPVTFALDRGGFVGDDGPTHHGVFDYSYLRSIPNLIVMAPKDENELQHMLRTAVDCGGPASVRYPRGRGAGIPIDETPHALDIGRAEILTEGDDVAIFAIGSMVYPSLNAARVLLDEGIRVRVINARFVKPLDTELLRETAAAIKKILTVEENVLMGGFGSAVLEQLEALDIHDVVVKRLGIRDEFVEHATQAELRRMHGIDEEGIAAAVRQMMVR
jgi:1-deoxy-D-xylulose-5-phosphate synthase